MSECKDVCSRYHALCVCSVISELHLNLKCYTAYEDTFDILLNVLGVADTVPVNGKILLTFDLYYTILILLSLQMGTLATND